MTYLVLRRDLVESERGLQRILHALKRIAIYIPGLDNEICRGYGRNLHCGDAPKTMMPSS